MNIQEIDFSKTLNDEQVYSSIMNNYSDLSKDWISHQWNWMNSVYTPFKDHYKYMIIISLIEKTLHFYCKISKRNYWIHYWNSFRRTFDGALGIE